MPRHLLFLFVIFLLIPVFGIFAQDELEIRHESEIRIDEERDTPWDLDDESVDESKRSDLWFGIGGDTAMYSQLGYALGGSFTIGYGAGSSIGIKVAWFFSEEGIDTVELNFLLRFYFLKAANQGPFAQIMGGPALFNRTNDFSVPSNSGMVSAGLALGWRFVLFNHWYIEPSIRGGYPYIFGATVATGVRF